MPKFGISAGLPDLPSGMSDEDYSKFVPLYRSLNSLAEFLSQATGNIEYTSGEQAQVDQLIKLTDSATRKVIVQAGEALNYGSLLNLTVSGGKLVAYKADATILARPAHAVCDKIGGISTGEYGEAVFLQGRTFGISGTTLGAAYYLSVGGTAQATPPVATGVLNQIVGVGLGTAGFYLNIEPVGRRPTLIYKFNSTTLRVLYSDGTYTDNAV